MITQGTQLEDSPRERQGTFHRVFKLLAWVNGLAAVGLALLLALPSFIDWGEYKGRIAKLAQDKLGANVKIDGAVYAQFLPVPVFRLNRVMISHPNYPEHNPLLVKRVDLELGFFSLLKGGLEPQAVLLKEPEFVFGLTENKTLTVPLGLRELFLGGDNLGLSRFGVKEATLSLVTQEATPRSFMSEVNFIAEKTGSDKNWSIEGNFMSLQSRHEFQLVTRARPEKKITYIDAQIHMTSGGNLVHNFNGSLSDILNGPVLEGRYKSNGRLSVSDVDYAVSSRGKINLSNRHMNLTGLSVSAVPVDEKNEGVAHNPLIMNAELKATQTPHAGRWALNGQVFSENINLNRVQFPDLSVVGLSSLVKFNKLASSLDGKITLRAKNIRSGVDVFPSFYAHLSLHDDVIDISNAGLGLPHGGSLQSDRLSAKATMIDGKELISYQGAVFFKTENIKDLARILPTFFESKDIRDLSDRSNQISLSGILEYSENGLAFNSRNLRLNGSSGHSGLLINPGRDGGTQLTLSLDKINLDRLFKTADKNVLDIFSLFANRAKSQAEDPNLNSKATYNISIDKLLWRGTALNDLNFTGQFSKDAAIINKFTIGGLDEESIALTMSGKMTDLKSHPKGAFDLTLTSPDALDVLSLISPQFVISDKGKGILGRAELISPFILTSKIVSSEEHKDLWQVKLEGRVATTQINSEGAFKANWASSDFMPQQIDMQFEISNPSSRYLASQLFALPNASLKSIPESEGFVRASISGAGTGSFDIALGGEVSDLQITLGGTAKFDKKYPSVAAQLKLFSPTSRSLLNFAGLAKTHDIGKTEYSMNLVGSDQQYILSGGHGIIGNREIGIDAKMDFSSTKPKIIAQIMSQRLRPNMVKRAVAALIDRDSAYKEMSNHADIQIVLASDILSLDEGVEISSARATMQLYPNKLELKALEGELYGGQLVMTGKASKSRDGLELSAQYELADGDLQRALLQENQDVIARGAFTLAGEIRSKAKNLSGIKKSLQGRGYIKAGKGELRGLNPAAFGRSVRFVSNGTELDGMIGGILSEGTIPFNQFQTAFVIKDGIFETHQTQLISREVSAKNNTRVDLSSGQINSAWSMQLKRLPKTPEVQLVYRGRAHNLKRELEHKKLRKHLMALMRKGVKLSNKFAANLDTSVQKVDAIHTGSIKLKRMKKPLKLDGLTVVPQVNPLRGTK